MPCHCEEARRADVAIRVLIPRPAEGSGPTGRFGDFSVAQAELLLITSALFAAQFARYTRYTAKKERHLPLLFLCSRHFHWNVTMP